MEFQKGLLDFVRDRFVIIRQHGDAVAVLSHCIDIDIRARKSLQIPISLLSARRVVTSASTRLPLRPAPPGPSNRANRSSISFSIVSRIAMRWRSRSFSGSITTRLKQRNRQRVSSSFVDVTFAALSNRQTHHQSSSSYLLVSYLPRRRPFDADVVR